jgi:hypothetical protein
MVARGGRTATPALARRRSLAPPAPRPTLRRLACPPFAPEDHRHAARDAAAPRHAYGPNACIICTRIAVEVCRAHGVKAEPLAVALDFTTDQVEGRLGFEPDGVPVGNYNAHVVCIVERRQLIDLTLDQVQNAQLGVVLEPTVLTIPHGFMRGGTVETTINGVHVQYEAHPEERGYLHLEDWNDRPERERVQTLVEAALRGAPIKRLPDRRGRARG